MDGPGRGRSLAACYRERYEARRVWIFHEAADVRRFRPLPRAKEHDVVWIGNGGDEERSAELRSYLLGSARRLPRLRFRTHGVRYPAEALREMAEAGIEYRGWVSSLDVHRARELEELLTTAHPTRSPEVVGGAAG